MLAHGSGRSVLGWREVRGRRRVREERILGRRLLRRRRRVGRVAIGVGAGVRFVGDGTDVGRSCCSSFYSCLGLPAFRGGSEDLVPFVRLLLVGSPRVDDSSASSLPSSSCCRFEVLLVIPR